ncbi:MAG: hypothetical protein JXK94_10935 [Deltaproteobacteria bacterium]|nr:hypothetical protein [Deltaproteobacteria bacterium]
MKKAFRILLFLVLSTLLAAPIFAGQQKTKTSPGDEKLVAMNASFQQFAQAKIKKLNNNHQHSRSRMQIQKTGNGLYCARFHEIDGSSLKYKVRRSKSKSVPYVGILSYQERVYEALGRSPEDCKNGKFAAISVIPNKHIFSFKKGAWN